MCQSLSKWGGSAPSFFPKNSQKNRETADDVYLRGTPPPFTMRYYTTQAIVYYDIVGRLCFETSRGPKNTFRMCWTLDFLKANKQIFDKTSTFAKQTNFQSRHGEYRPFRKGKTSKEKPQNSGNRSSSDGGPKLGHVDGRNRTNVW